MERLLGRERVPRVLLVQPTPFDGNEKARNSRNEAALSLVDPDTYGYVLVRLRRPEDSSAGKIEVQGYVLPAWWPSFRETFQRIEDAAGEFLPPE